MIFSLIVGFLLGAAAIVFAFENREVVSLSYLGWQFETSLALLVLMSVAVGALISLLVSLPSIVGDAFKMMRLKSENRKLVREVETQREAASAPTIVVTDASSPVVDLRSS